MITSVLFSSPVFNLLMLLLIFSELAFQSHVVITHTNYINASSGAARLAHITALFAILAASDSTAAGSLTVTFAVGFAIIRPELLL